MSTDRELLDLAAKAAGMDIRWERDPAFIQERWTAYVPCGWAGQPSEREWNPLRESGDALDLAVKLGIAIQLHPAWVYARAVMPGDHYQWMEITEGWGNGGDPYAATRRAIVRAAAEVGRAA